MAETDALSGAKFGSSLWLTDFPARIRVLTRDPMVYNDSFGNTRYAFAVYNVDIDKLQILNKGSGFAQRFQEINADPDFGNDIRKIDVKITTNGRQGKDIRYTITPIGAPHDLLPEVIQYIRDNGFDLAEKIRRNNPAALRLSEVNAGAKVPDTQESELQPSNTAQDVVIEDVPDNMDNFDLNDIPF